MSSQSPAWSIPTLREPRYSQSLERGLAILESFTAREPVLGIADIAERLEMSRSTTHRYVTTLVELGYLEQGAARKYRLTIGVVKLGLSALSGMSIAEHARPLLDELRRHAGFAVAVGVLDGSELVILDRLPALVRKRGQLPPQEPGARLPATQTAMGKLLLAGLPEDVLTERVRKLTLAKAGPNAITSKRALHIELDALRETRDVVVSDQEIAADVLEIAAPVRNAAGEAPAACSVTAHASDISVGDLVDAIGPLLLATTARISARLGHRREDELVA